MLSYDPEIIPHIPSLDVADRSVKESATFGQFLSEFEALVTSAGLQDSLGVTLVHRHANVPLGSRMMDFKQTLQPFPVETTAKNLYGHPIRWKSVTLHGDDWKPYEYELGDEPGEDLDFFLAMRKLLQRHELSNVGLRRFSPHEPEELEITEKLGVSVKIPWVSSDDKGHTTTFWALPSSGPKDYRCACTDTGGTGGSNHNHIDQP